MIAPTSEVTGLVRIEDRAKGRVWIAEYRRADRKKVRPDARRGRVRETPGTSGPIGARRSTAGSPTARRPRRDRRGQPASATRARVSAMISASRGPASS